MEIGTFIITLLFEHLVNSTKLGFSLNLMMLISPKTIYKVSSLIGKQISNFGLEVHTKITERRQYFLSNLSIKKSKRRWFLQIEGPFLRNNAKQILPQGRGHLNTWE